MFSPKLLSVLFGLLIVAAQCSYSAARPTNHGHDEDGVRHHHDHHHHRHHEHKHKHEKFISFETFLDQVKHAKFEQYRHTSVLDEEAFKEMQLHILYTYEGVGEVTSFFLEHDYADCIAILRQPSLRTLGIRELAKPPTDALHPETTECQSPGNFTYVQSPLRRGLKDIFGNPISCPKHAFAMARQTLEKLTRYATLGDFFSKPSPSAEIHLHAYGSQSVTNYGGNSWLNLWNPTGDFSISQQWYLGESEGVPLQTVEGGWVVNRLRHPESALSRLFIYYTPDGYNATNRKSCWNNDCNTFVQINNNWYLDGPWDHYSVSGGEQWGFQLQWKLYQGNWWLFIKGPGNIEAVGYYSTKIFNGGQLSKSSTTIIYGGEVANYTGGNSFPQMGSAAQAEKGFTKAAFQNTIFYILQNGAGVWADLTAEDEANAKCYTIDLVESANGGNWGTYFFFGGPGGLGCI